MVKPFGSALSSQQQSGATPTLLQDFPGYLNSLAWGSLSSPNPENHSLLLLRPETRPIQLLAGGFHSWLNWIRFSQSGHSAQSAVILPVLYRLHCCLFFTYLLWLNMLSPTTTPPSLYLSVKKIKLAFGHHITCISKCKWQHLSSRNWKCTGGNDGTKPANHGCSFLHWFWEVLIRFQCRILTFSFKMPMDSVDPLVLVLPMFDISYSYDWHVTLNRSAVLKALVH